MTGPGKEKAPESESGAFSFVIHVLDGELRFSWHSILDLTDRFGHLFP
jgi:hypothetical protein